MVLSAPVQELYDQLVKRISANASESDMARFNTAFEYAHAAHAEQKRKDGSEYITHPLNVAIIVSELGMDMDSVIAALLHDVIEDTDASLEDISKKFSESVGHLVDGLTKLRQVQYTSKEEEQMENLRKMFMAMAKDIRVILIKICDRLHNMRTMQFQPPLKQKQISLETMEIYAPIAHRLGMQRIKWELEDICLKYLDPVGYEEITGDIEKFRSENEGFIEKICAEIQHRLDAADQDATVYGRVKHIYSLYRKMYSQNKQIGEIYDYFAFRVVVNTITECYNVLGLIHDEFKPIPGRFKDYISTPKPNLYQSLHTAVIGTDGTPFEVQIRTWDMHNTAEYGIAAHWKYKQGMGAKSADEEKFEWVRRLLENQQEMDAEDFISTLKVDMFADEVFVFTPKGDVINLPAGATPIDFAYAIHSAVGNNMVGAKVNGRLVNYDYILKNGDIAEVITSKAGHGPSRDWMTIAKSNEARTKIRQWFKKEKREENIVRGRSSFEAELKRQGLTMDAISDEELQHSVLKRMTFQSLEDVLAAIGYGGVTSVRVVNRFKDELTRLNKLQTVRTAALRIPVDAPKKVTESGVEVQGLDNCLTKFSRCCCPVPGDEIIGFITRGFGVSVHRRDCANVVDAMSRGEDAGRWVDVNWANAKDQMFETRLQIFAKDKDGLVLDIVTALNAQKVKVLSLNARNIGAGKAEVNITVSVTGITQLREVINRIQKFNGIMEVRRMNT